ncbi:hypothetical protein EGY07_07130 [Chryseobacterium indologenes]|uniref:hypothetical protein n=1 Tax=Chryseobacterium indologenes TaxID=253 RepID=UPI000F504218|nr:hypothetical protein [Chryseobacterium indologenes]AYZ35358.1 hypothetical protein EGY07_07130 [Chryseobacterium indologenes]MBF6644101.1 hypothetical protein [Chryseobacterium indologenes]MBU3050543.1 hypothetical protein [Chryseobacterium indologenes]MEB4763296.1 hypothetical protein [Chryseobacterium indologenes]QQQ72180.1 hypothetical protein JHW31_05490 [Chryseobacterium indologenes]
MKNLFLSIIAMFFLILACKKNDAQNNVSVTDSTTVQKSYTDTVTPTPQNSADSTRAKDSINTKTHIGGRKTSNNNTGNASGNINAAVSDSAHPQNKSK